MTREEEQVLRQKTCVLQLSALPPGTPLGGCLERGRGEGGRGGRRREGGEGGGGREGGRRREGGERESNR